MKRFLLKILLFLAILTVVDLLLGVGFNHMRDKAQGNNEQSRNLYLSQVTEAPIVVLGSSRAYHHYVSPVMSEIIGKETVNAGEDGNGIILAYGRYLLMAERYTPQIVVLDIEPGFDIATNDNSRYLRLLRPFYGTSDNLRKLFHDIDSKEPTKMLSRTYRYNSLLPTMAKSMMAKDSVLDYELLFGQKPDFDIRVSRDKTFEGTYDPLKRKYLIKFIEETRRQGTIPIIAFSPHYGRTNSDELAAVKKVANQYDVPILDHYADTTFVNHKELFVDPFHLNDKGAEEYTRVIAKELLRYIPQK